ncbi:MAG TPA: glycoside hydrolase, partial [Catenuloplanes sp.]
MSHRQIAARAVAAAAAATLAVGLAAAPAAATDAAGAGAAQAATPEAVTVRVDPSYQQPEFEGWGSSLVWFANATGQYPDAIRKQLVDMLYGRDGLRLNIARYNIGGGNAPDVRKDYMKMGATMEGFWKAPPGTTQKDMDWWNPNDPGHWNWNADPGQRWWVDQIKSKVDRWEAFSNSPPWFQTVSGYVSGGFDSSADQIREDRLDDFATYLVKVTDRMERAHGIKFDTIAPLNEPNTPYWYTRLGPDGQPTGGRQEGAHAGPALQGKVVLALEQALKRARTKATISAMDETNPGVFTQNWNGYTPATRAAIDQLNVHTYGTGMRTAARDIAKGADKKLWMSEVEGNWGKPTTYTSMEPGLGIANRIVDDLRELEPAAWVSWQPIEDAGPQVAGNGNWGAIHVPFNCTAKDTLQTCPIKANTKFDTMRNFTHHIAPGDQLVRVEGPSSVAAIKRSGDAATVVHVNNGTAARAVTLDLSRFDRISSGATVTPVVTSEGAPLVRGTPVRVSNGSATLVVPAKSVTTFLIKGVKGVEGHAAMVQRDHVYRLQGVQAGKSLAPSADATSVVVRNTDPASAEQLWRVRKLTGGKSNLARHEIVNAANGRRLSVRDGAAVLDEVPGSKRKDTVADDAQWIMSTTGDKTWTFVNVASGRLLEVAGFATADGSRVGTYTPTSNANQRWTVVDETVLDIQQAHAYTMPGFVPTLPTTVTPVYRDGARGSLPVTWRAPSAAKWRKPGTVRVRGEATDPLGGKHRAEAVVMVDTFGATLPGRAKTYVGGRPELPRTVTGVGSLGGRAELPVSWDAPPDTAFARAGVVTLRGVVRLMDGG